MHSASSLGWVLDRNARQQLSLDTAEMNRHTGLCSKTGLFFYFYKISYLTSPKEMNKTVHTCIYISLGCVAIFIHYYFLVTTSAGRNIT